MIEPAFLVCGEALFDLFITDAMSDRLHCQGVPGGSPFNVAIGLARLGHEVQFFGGMSNDMLGSRLVDKLRAENVRTDLVRRVDAATTLSLIQLSDSGSPRYAFYGNAAADRLITPSSLPAMAAWQAIHVGSYSMVVPPVADSLFSLVARAHQTTVVSYDPNVRLNVEPSLQAWKDRIAAMLPYTHLLKISDEDLELIYGQHDRTALAQAWLQAGVKMVVVTRGRDGAQAWTSRGHAAVAGQRIEIADTVGAGDTVQAALLSHLSRTGRLSIAALGDLDAAQLDELLRYSTAAAAVTCSRRGADMPSRAEVDARFAG